MTQRILAALVLAAAVVVSAVVVLKVTNVLHGPANPDYDPGNCVSAQQVQKDMQFRGFYTQTDQDLVDKYCKRYR